jgi:hypothetical protein
LFKRLENHKRSLSGSDSGQSDQGPAKKKRGRPRKSAAADSDDKPDKQEDEEQLPSSEVPAAKGPAKKMQGKGSKAAVATGMQDASSLAATTVLDVLGVVLLFKMIFSCISATQSTVD